MGSTLGIDCSKNVGCRPTSNQSPCEGFLKPRRLAAWLRRRVHRSLAVVGVFVDALHIGQFKVHLKMAQSITMREPIEITVVSIDRSAPPYTGATKRDRIQPLYLVASYSNMIKATKPASKAVFTPLFYACYELLSPLKPARIALLFFYQCEKTDEESFQKLPTSPLTRLTGQRPILQDRIVGRRVVDPERSRTAMATT